MVNYYRTIILGFNIGLWLWLIVAISILHGNYNSTTRRSRKTLAILLLFGGWFLDISWQLFLTIIRIIDQEPALLPVALALKIVALIATTAAITNFMYVMYGDYIKRRIKGWLDV